jgi:mannan endo-1,4-beta-mannosidase
LIAVGEEAAAHHGCAEVDLATCHLYPENYRLPGPSAVEAGSRYIAAQARAAGAQGKPLVVEELGLSNLGAFSLDGRRQAYRTWFAAAWEAGAAGVGPWLFAYDERPDEWDDFTFYWKDTSALDDRRNRYADLVAEAALRFG